MRFLLKVEKNKNIIKKGLKIKKICQKGIDEKEQDWYNIKALEEQLNIISFKGKNKTIKIWKIF